MKFQLNLNFMAFYCWQGHLEEVRYKRDKLSRDKTLQLIFQHILNMKNMYHTVKLRTILSIILYRFKRKFIKVIFILVLKRY
jgi:hypothetical protein